MDKTKFQKVLRRAVWFPFGTALILAAILILEVQFLMKRAGWVEHADSVISISQRIYRNRVDQESGLRGYLLTYDERFLQPFYEGRQQASDLEPQLQQLVADNPEQKVRNEKASQAFQAWSVWADEAITLVKNGEDAGNVGFQLRGRELMDKYRQARAEFLERQQQLRDERLRRSRRSVEFVTLSVVGLCVLLAVGFAGMGRRLLNGLSRSFSQALNRAESNALEAQSQKERLGGIIESAMDAIITVDEAQRIQVFNRAAEQIFRCSLSEALGQPLEKFIPERFRQAHRQHVSNFGHTGVTNRSMFRPGTLWGLRHDGDEFPIEATISQVETGSQRLFTVILRDISERVRTEEALRKAEKAAATGSMAATLAHEINNPLAAITNLAYLLRTDPMLPDHLREQANMLDEELTRLGHIVRQTLSLYRPQPVPPLAIRLSRVVDEVLEIYQAKLSGVAIEKRYDSDFFVTGNHVELHQLVSNLILNAVEAAPNGQGSVKIHLGAARDWQNPERQGVRIVVADSGTGIPPEVRPHIFKPFFTTKQQKGTGLGLSVVQWVASKHGGWVRVRSSTRPGRSGTCVSVFLCPDGVPKHAPAPAHSSRIARSQAS